MSQSHSYKVCLINPPVLAVLEPWYDTPDFGRTALAYLAGYLRQFEGFEVEIIDAKFERLNFQNVLDRVRKFKPDLVGFTAFTNEIKPAAYQSAMIKKEFPEIVSIIGGVHLTAVPKQTLNEFPSFDIGVVGEGEATLYELCDALKNGRAINEINGLVFRTEGSIEMSAPRERILDQDSIPFPAWDLMPPAETYFVQSARGCPLNCIFCMNPNGRVARKRTVPNVIEELEWIINDFKPKSISFGDELFSVDMDRAGSLLDAMAEANIGERVKWDVQTHVKFVDYDLFTKFNKAKVERVELGVESGDVEILKKMGKGTTMKDIEKAFTAAAEAKVSVGSFFLFGQPNETTQSMQKTIDLAVKINPDLPMFGLMTPYPGTEVARMAAEGKNGFKLISTDWDEYNKQIGGAMEFANLNRRQIERMQVIAYSKVFLLNYRFLDFAKLVWEYRIGAWSVLKKIILNQKTIGEQMTKPADYEEMISSPEPLSIEEMVVAREAWKKTQNAELKRAKQLKPELFNLRTA